MKTRNRMVCFIVVLCSFFAGCASVKSIDITNAPNKTVYGQGQDLDLTGLVVTGTYSNNNVQVVKIGASNISGYNKHQVGQQTVMVRSGEGTAYFTVTVKPLLSISLERPPVKTLYRQGENLDLNDITLSGSWEGLGSQRILVTRELVSMYTLEVPGALTITVSFENRTLSFPVTVAPLSSISITRPPTKLIYKQGEELDLTGLIVTGTWQGLANQQLTVGSGNISGFDANTIGQQILTVFAYNVSASFVVTVKGLITIEITRPPNKLIYDYGETLDITGLVVTGTFSDSSRELIPVSASNISRYDQSKTGEQAVMVTVEGRNAVFTILVRVLNYLSVQRPPNKGVYEPGETLDLNGLVVVGTYSDGSTRIIPVNRIQFTGFNSKIPGQQTVTITAEGKQAVFTVVVLTPKQ